MKLFGDLEYTRKYVMKKIKNKICSFSIILIICLSNLSVIGQNPEVMLNDIEADPGEIEVPLEMQNFTDEVNSFTFKFELDTLQLEYIGVSDVVGFSQGSFTSFQDGSVLNIQWFNMNGYQPNGYVFNLVFDFTGTAHTEIDFIESDCEVTYDVDPVPNIEYTNGMVFTTEPIPDPSLALPSFDTLPSHIAIPITANNFAELITALDFSIQAENQSLEFNELVNISDDFASGTWDITQDNNIVNINWITDLEGVFPQGKLFDMMFTYYGGFSSDLLWQENTAVTNEEGEDIENINYTDGSVVQTETNNQVQLSAEEALPNTDISLPLTFQDAGFENTQTFNLTLSYSPADLVFDGLSAQILDIEVSTEGNELSLSWNGSPQDLNGQDVAALNFLYTGNTATTIAFEPGSFSQNQSEDFIETEYVNSNISPIFPQDTLNIMSNHMFAGQSVTLPVTTTAIEDISEIELHIEYEDDFLNFQQFSAEQLSGWNLDASGDNLVFTWTGEESLNEGNLLLLEFIYSQVGEASVGFSAESIITDAENPEIIIAYIGGSVSEAENNAESTISSITDCSNNLATVPVTLTQAEAFDETYLQIAYNQDVIDFNELLNINPQLEDYELSEETGLITFSWSGSGPTLIEGTLFELEFEYSGGYSLITFTEGSQFFEGSGASLPVKLNNGEVDCELDYNTLTLNSSGEGDITVSQDGTVLEPDEGTLNQYTVLYDEELTLEAIPDEGWLFQYWVNEPDTIWSNPYNLAMDQNYQVNAAFAADSFELSLTNIPEDAGIVFGEGIYLYGEEATAEAVPYSGYSFLHWKDEDENIVSDNPVYVFPMPPADYSLQAHYQANIYNLSLSAIPDSAGIVNGAGEYSFGNQVTIEAIPENNWEFVKWTNENGIFISNNPEYIFSMPYSNIHYYAHFETDVSSDMIQQEAGIKVYPNPASSKIMVSVDTKDEHLQSLHLLNITGNTVHTKEVSNQSNVYIMDIHQLNPGIYILHIQFSNSATHKKVIVN